MKSEIFKKYEIYFKSKQKKNLDFFNQNKKYLKILLNVTDTEM